VPADRQAHGRYGEDRAAAWYVEQGYTVLDRNWRAGRSGEIDLVVGRGTLVVVCEVKARSSTTFGQPFEAVTAAKQLRIRRLAAQWLAAHPVRERRDVRFDVVSVLGGRVEVIEEAF
jgi:putative endonuclease